MVTMSNRALSILADCGPIFCGARKAVLTALADRTGDGGTCWPSYDRLAWDSGAARRSCIREIEGLEKMGLLSVERGGGHKSNLYRVNLELVKRLPLGKYLGDCSTI